jgi:hypothetical protein
MSIQVLICLELVCEYTSSDMSASLGRLPRLYSSRRRRRRRLAAAARLADISVQEYVRIPMSVLLDMHAHICD